MFFSLRARLFAISTALIAIFVVIVGLFLHHNLQRWGQSSLESDLQTQALIVAEATRHLDDDEATLSLLQRLHNLPDQRRITIIDAQGIVIADTDLDDLSSPTVDNHNQRPEVQTARHEGLGVERRFSDSVEQDLLYVAIADPDSQRVIRLSMPLDQVDELVAHLRLLLLVGTLLGLAVAILMSSLASRLMAQTLERLLQRSRPSPRDPGDNAFADDLSSPAQLATRLEDAMTALTDERNRFRSILDGMNEGVIATDQALTIQLANPAANRLLGADLSSEDYSLRRWLPDSVVDELMADLEQSSQATAEFTLPIPPERRIRLQLTRRQDGPGFIFVLHDVTTLRQLETMRRDFVANVSHELRTPVAVIQGHAETLIDGALKVEEDALYFSEGIRDYAARLSTMIGELLELSTLEAGQQSLSPTPLNLYGHIDDTIHRLTLLDERHADQVTIDVDPDLLVIADDGALDQILTNLLDNAFHYGGNDVSIHISAIAEDDRVRVQVSDDGPGVDPDDQPRIFERFYRADSGRQTNKSGTGLGLAIVKHLVASMGGEVGYEDRPDRGASFWFTLRIGQPS